jgi:NitT/TauT family transport system substrate-binding protein
VFGGAFPAACLYAQADLLKKTPNTAQALATAIVRADEWLQTASPADVAATVPEGYLLGDKPVYEKSFAGVRETISPDGLMPAGAMENCLKFLAETDPAIKPDGVKFDATWTNEFAERAKKHS